MEIPSGSFLEVSKKFQAMMKANEEQMRKITEQVEQLAEAHAAEMFERERKVRSHEELAGNLRQLMVKKKAENAKLATCQEALLAFQTNVSSLGLSRELRISIAGLVNPSGVAGRVLSHNPKVEILEADQVAESSPTPLSVRTPITHSGGVTQTPTVYRELVAYTKGCLKRQRSSANEVIVLSSDDSCDEKDGAVQKAEPLLSCPRDLKEVFHSDRRGTAAHSASSAGCDNEVLHGATKTQFVRTTGVASFIDEGVGANKDADVGQSSSSGGAGVWNAKAPSLGPAVDRNHLTEVGASKDVEDAEIDRSLVSALAATFAAAHPVKRKRGRPRKYSLPESAKHQCLPRDSQYRDAFTASASVPIKRRPGRPRKYPPKPGQVDYEKMNQVTASTPQVFDTAGQLPALRLNAYMKKKEVDLRRVSGSLLGKVCDRLEHEIARVGLVVEIPPLVQITQPSDLKLRGWDDVASLNSAEFRQVFTRHAYEFAILLQENVKKHLWQPKWFLVKALEGNRQELTKAFESIVMAFSSNGFRDFSTQKLRDELMRSVSTFVKLYRSKTENQEPLRSFKLRTAKQLMDEWELKYWRYQKVPDAGYHTNIDTDAVREGYLKLKAARRYPEAASVKRLLDVIRAVNPSTSTPSNELGMLRGEALVGEKVKCVVKGIIRYEGDVIHYSHCDGHHVLLLKNDYLKCINLSDMEVIIE